VICLSVTAKEILKSEITKSEIKIFGGQHLYNY